jgi:hypothetical protein
MKQTIFYLFLSLLLFSSCQKEIVQPDPYVWPEGTGEYGPYTIGSSFHYQVTNSVTALNDSFIYTVTKDTIIDNLRFYKLQSSKGAIGPLPASYFVNYSNDKLTEITYNLDYLGLHIKVLDKVSENTLRTNVDINHSWHEDLDFDIFGYDLTANFDYRLVQKNYNKIVLGKNYPDTYFVRELITTAIPAGFPLPPGVPTSSQFDNYYTKGAGLIQRDISEGTSMKLINFSVVKY